MATAGASSSKKKKTKKQKILDRLVFDLVLFVILLSTGTALLYKSLQFEAEKVVKYNERSNIDYRVYLLKNDFYEQEFLGKDMLYVASLIDKVQLDFNYDFATEENENIDFEYSIVAKLSITNPADTKSYFDKSYTLLEPKTVNMRNASVQSIKEQVIVNYPYYNGLANGFRNQYGVDAESRLTVYMVVNKKNTQESDYILDSSNVMNIVIPLSERSVDIKLDYKEINETSNIIKKKTMTVKDYLPLALAAVFVLLSLVMMVKAMRNFNLLHRKKSEYDKQVARILKEYDRLIAESQSLMSFDNKQIIHINKFTELLDIHDNLQLPIMYYTVEAHQQCYFYIHHQDVIYLFQIVADDDTEEKQ